MTLDAATADPQAILDAARACLRRVVFDRKLRLLGVRVGSLVRSGEEATYPLPKASRVAETASPLFEDSDL